jgi:hypothetical protein
VYDTPGIDAFADAVRTIDADVLNRLDWEFDDGPDITSAGLYLVVEAVIEGIDVLCKTAVPFTYKRADPG